MVLLESFNHSQGLSDESLDRINRSIDTTIDLVKLRGSSAGFAVMNRLRSKVEQENKDQLEQIKQNCFKAKIELAKQRAAARQHYLAASCHANKTSLELRVKAEEYAQKACN
jgi:hypothetical protein